MGWMTQIVIGTRRAGRSIPAVRKHGVLVDRVRFPAARTSEASEDCGEKPEAFFAERIERFCGHPFSKMCRKIRTEKFSCSAEQENVPGGFPAVRANDA